LERSEKLKRKARTWRILGVLAFLVGAFLIWERVSYNLHDFYAENFNLPTKEVITRYALGSEQRDHLASAMDKMQAEDYWSAATDLDKIKEIGGPAIQVAEWYKTLCMIGLEEKELATALLQYYSEQPDFSFKKREVLALLQDY
jgi:hypothetical protein